MARRLPVLLFLLPFLELFGLLWIGRWAGFGSVLLLVIGTGALGLFLLRRAGLRTILSLQGELLRGKVPARSLVDGVALFGAGVLLMVPGVLTDLLGIIFLLPPMRALLYRGAQVRLAAAVSRGSVQVTRWGFMGIGGVYRGSGWGTAPGSPTPDPGSSLESADAEVLAERVGTQRPPRPGEIIQE